MVISLHLNYLKKTLHLYILNIMYFKFTVKSKTLGKYHAGEAPGLEGRRG